MFRRIRKMFAAITKFAAFKTIARFAARAAKKTATAAKALVRSVAGVGHAVAHATLGALASAEGQQAVANVAKGAATAVTSTVSRIGRALGSVLGFTGRMLLAVIGKASPAAADKIRGGFQAVASGIGKTVAPVRRVISMAATVAGHLASTPLVRRTTMIAARAMVLLVGVNALAEGAIASAVASALPMLGTAAHVVLTPAGALAVVLGVAMASMGVGLSRLLRQTSQTPEMHVVPDQVEDDSDEPIAASDSQSDALPDLAQIARSITIRVDADASLHFDGIPEALPAGVQDAVREVAEAAATAHLERIMHSRRRLTRDDRRLLTKAAREAILSAGRQVAAEPEAA